MSDGIKVSEPKNHFLFIPKNFDSVILDIFCSMTFRRKRLTLHWLWWQVGAIKNDRNWMPNFYKLETNCWKNFVFHRWKVLTLGRFKDRLHMYNKKVGKPKAGKLWTTRRLDAAEGRLKDQTRICWKVSFLGQACFFQSLIAQYSTAKVNCIPVQVRRHQTILYWQILSFAPTISYPRR